jgi:glycosyltransferase involved in cell wall biosynthesis
MKVGILLSGRFPTEKAYGVTTNGTIKSLLDLGHEVVVFGIKSEYHGEIPEDNQFAIENYQENLISLFLKKFSFSNYGKMNQIAWKLYWFLAKHLNKEKISTFDFDLIWIRDKHMLRFSHGARNIVIEIHQRIKESDCLQLAKISRTKKLLVAPISPILLKSIDEIRSDLNIVYAPMGINPEMISNQNSSKLFVSNLLNRMQTKSGKLQIGYVGKFYPNGYSKGIEDLLKLSRVKEPLSETFNISLTGGTEKEILKLKRAISEEQLSIQNLEVNPHVPHALALEKMKNLDVIILPKPDSEDYLGFPLKCIEAVASGRIILAAKCRTYTDVFSDSFQPYWYEPGDASSLYNSIVQALSDSDLEAKINTGLVFAEQFGWETRTKNIVSNLFEDSID